VSELLKLEESTYHFEEFKFGVLSVCAGAETENDIYKNNTISQDFEEFLDAIGTKIKLKDFENFAGGLDTKTNEDGIYSLLCAFLIPSYTHFHLLSSLLTTCRMPFILYYIQK
jgi:hypothetical protein